MILPAPIFPMLSGELPGDRIARIMRLYDGFVPLGPHPVGRDALAGLVGRGIDDESVVDWRTNCCTFALGLLFAAGVDHPILKKPLRNGLEFTDMVTLGYSFSAWRVAVASEIPPRGALLWYRVAGQNDDHVEVMLDAPDEHGGGGRPDNAITIGRSDPHVSNGRPLWRWLDPAALEIPTLPVADPHLDPSGPNS